MNQRANLVAVSLFAAIGLFAVAVVVSGVGYYQQMLSRTAQNVQQPTPQTFQAAHLDVKPTPSADEQETTPAIDEYQRVVLMKGLLEARNKELQKKSAELREKTRELEDLKTRYDETVKLALDVISETGPMPENPTDAQQIQEDLRAMSESQEMLEAQVAMLQLDLDEAYQELTAMQEDADVGMASLIDAQSAQQNEMVRVLRTVGEEAVPALLNSLRDENPEVRRWACEMLGSLGNDARDAMDALDLALGDSDLRVRAAARVALQTLSE